MTSKPSGSVQTSGSDRTNGSEAEEVNDDSTSVPFAVSDDDAGEVGKSCCSKVIPHSDAVHLNSFLQRTSKRVARNPCTYMCTSIFVTLALSAIGLIVGEFAIEVENEGWWSRGTPQSDKQRQANIVRHERYNLAYNMSAWDIWTDPDVDHSSYEQLLYSMPTIPDAMKLSSSVGGDLTGGTSFAELSGDLRARSLRSMQGMIEQAMEQDEERRRLDEGAPMSVLSGCDFGGTLGFYGNPSSLDLWPVWRIPDEVYESTDTRSVLDADILESICLAEMNTQVSFCVSLSVFFYCRIRK